jgi:translation initiation factor IF-2
MAKSNVTQFAEELKLPVGLLLEQLQAAGVKKKTGEDAITEQDKTRLLDYLREMHGNKDEKKKITLTRKQTTEIKKSDATGKARTIQVEVRKKRTFVKVDKPEPVPEPEKPVVAPAPIINEEEARKRETEAKRQAELAARQLADAQSKTRASSRRRTRPKRPAPAAEAPAARGRGGRCHQEEARHPQEGRGARDRSGGAGLVEVKPRAPRRKPSPGSPPRRRAKARCTARS